MLNRNAKQTWTYNKIHFLVIEMTPISLTHLTLLLLQPVPSLTETTFAFSTLHGTIYP